MFFSLQHIQDVALISRDDYKIKTLLKPHLSGGGVDGKPLSEWGLTIIEGYDISTISGTNSVGSMVVFKNNKPDKSEYKRFKIKSVKGVNDIAMLDEVLMRRFKHKDWQMPGLILIDGGLGQLNIAKKVLKFYNLDIPIVAMAKGVKRKKADLRYWGKISEIDIDILKHIRDESHRFAIAYHRKLRDTC